MFRVCRGLLSINSEFFRKRFDLETLVPPVWSGLSAERSWQRYPLHFVVAVGSVKDITDALSSVSQFTGQCGRDMLPQGHVSINDWNQDTLETPLDYAIQRGDVSIVELLLKHGAKPSPLSVQRADKLVEEVADPQYRERMGRILEKVHTKEEAAAILALVTKAYKDKGAPALK